ncbi:MAG: flippase [Candidatus Jacksonbacteria bacterium]|jgi:O-antigen/teichoic acid export membrane protein|nr:flippase [Candidatus Jacksonbacteria bacterium]
MTLIKKISVQSGIQIAGKALSTLIGIVALSLLTRMLGADGFGRFHTITVFVSFFGVVADFGLYLLALKDLSAPDQDESTTFSKLLGSRIVLSSFFYLLTPAVALLFPYSPTLLFGIVLTALMNIFNSISQLSTAVFQKHFATHRIAIAEIVGRLILLAILFYASTKTRANLTWALLAIVVGSFVSMVLHLSFLRKFIKLSITISVQSLKKILSSSWPIALSIFFSLIYFKTDSIILSLFRPTHEVGLYGVPYRILETAIAIPIIIMGLFLPQLSQLWHEKNIHQFKQTLNNAFKFIIFLAAPLVGISVLVARPLMLLFAGEQFVQEHNSLNDLSNIFVLLTIATAVIFIGAIFSQLIVTINSQKAMLKWYIIIAIIALSLYLLLIPHYSYYAAAFITIGAELAVGIAAYFHVRKKISYTPDISFGLKSILFAAIPTVVLIPLAFQLIPAILLYTIIYGASHWLAGSFASKT